MTGTMTSQNIDLSSWDILYRALYNNTRNVKKKIWITIREWNMK
jgi:hypothetical protein